MDIAPRMPGDRPKPSPVPPAGWWNGGITGVEEVQKDGRTVLVSLTCTYRAPSVMVRPDGTEYRSRTVRAWTIYFAFDWSSAKGRASFAALCGQVGLTERVTDASALVGKPVRLHVRTRGGRRSAFVKTLRGIPSPD